MFQVQINNFNLSGLVVEGWSVVSQHTNQIDAQNQMAIYIENNGIDPSSIKIVEG